MFYTTAKEKTYPEFINITETLDSDMVKCESYDPTGLSIIKCSISLLRPYSLNEFWKDLCDYYPELKSESFEDVFSEDFSDFLKEQISNFDTIIEEIDDEVLVEGFDFSELPSSELWEHDHAEEVRGLLKVLEESLQEEKEACEDKKKIISPSI